MISYGLPSGSTRITSPCILNEGENGERLEEKMENGASSDWISDGNKTAHAKDVAE